MTGSEFGSRTGGENFVAQRLPQDGGLPKDTLTLTIEAIGAQRRLPIKTYIQEHGNQKLWLMHVAEAAGVPFGARGVSTTIRGIAEQHGVDTSHLRVSLNQNVFEEIAFEYVQSRFVNLDEIAGRLREAPKDSYSVTDVILIALARPRPDTQLSKKVKALAIKYGTENSHHSLKITPQQVVMVYSEIPPYKTGKADAKIKYIALRKKIKIYADESPQKSVTDILRAVDIPPSDLYIRELVRKYLAEREIKGKTKKTPAKLFVNAGIYARREFEKRAPVTANRKPSYDK